MSDGTIELKNKSSRSKKVKGLGIPDSGNSGMAGASVVVGAWDVAGGSSCLRF